MFVKMAVSAVVFVLLSCLKAGSWDALGMGFISIRFRIFHLYLIPLMALRDLVRGVPARDMNLRMAAVCTALLLGALAISAAVGFLVVPLVWR